MKKWKILLLLVATTIVLMGCGKKLDGTYINKTDKDTGTMVISGENVSIKMQSFFLGAYEYTGTVDKKEKTMNLTRTIFGMSSDETATYEILESGNLQLIIDEDVSVFVRQEE